MLKIVMLPIAYALYKWGAISIMEPKNQLYGDRGEGPVWRSMVDCDTQGTFVK